MKTIGQILKEARLKKNLKRQDIASRTKIREDYLEAIEANQFGSLPSATFVKGFIGNYARAVDLDPNQALAVFRRDFDQNLHGKIIPRGLSHPIATPSRVWNPKTTTIALAVALVSLLGLYSIRQLVNFSQAPPITLDSPQTEAVTGPIIEVAGSTSSDATLTINQKPVSLDISGNFQTNINLEPGEHTLIIEASSRDGKTRTLTQPLTVSSPE